MNKLFFLLCSVIAVVLIFFVFIIPKYKSLQALKIEVTELEKNIEIVKNLEASREALDKKRLSISPADLEKLEKIVPSSPDNIRLIIQLDEIAKRNGLTMLTDVSYDASMEELPPGQTEDTSVGYRSYDVSFQTTGQYGQFLVFLKEVEKNLRLVDIVSVDLKNVENEKSIVPSQTFKVELKAYWLSEVYE